jgi:hypothetical protein
MKCENCKFYEEAEDIEFGYCRRYAPKPLICSANADETEWEAHRYVKWPDVHCDYWCGEFKPKGEKS